MKDSRFIELLNLYVDREITPTEAAELEAEVQRGEQRRQVFNQYCRLDRACTVVLSRGKKAPTPRLAAALADADRRVEAFPESSGGRAKLVFLCGMLAAAAALAVVFYNREARPAPAVNPAPVRSVVQVVTTPSTAIRTGREEALALPFGGDRPVQTASAVPPAFAWMKHMELTAMTPLADEDLKLVAAHSEKTFSSRLNWGLHRENAAFPRAGVTRSPTQLNAFEVGK